MAANIPDRCVTVLEELNKDYVTGARARGIRSRVIIWKSVMKASMTIITLLALSIGNLLEELPLWKISLCGMVSENWR